MKEKTEIIILVVVLVLIYTRPSALVRFSSSLVGKLILLVAIVLSSLISPLSGLLIATMMVLFMEQNYEGFKEGNTVGAPSVQITGTSVGTNSKDDTNLLIEYDSSITDVDTFNNDFIKYDINITTSLYSIKSAIPVLILTTDTATAVTNTTGALTAIATAANDTVAATTPFIYANEVDYNILSSTSSTSSINGKGYFIEKQFAILASSGYAFTAGDVLTINEVDYNITTTKNGCIIELKTALLKDITNDTIISIDKHTHAHTHEGFEGMDDIQTMMKTITDITEKDGDANDDANDDAKVFNKIAQLKDDGVKIGPTTIGWRYNGDYQDEIVWNSLIVEDEEQTGFGSDTWFNNDHDGLDPQNPPSGWNAVEAVYNDGTPIPPSLISEILRKNPVPGNWKVAIDLLKQTPPSSLTYGIPQPQPPSTQTTPLSPLYNPGSPTYDLDTSQYKTTPLSPPYNPVSPPYNPGSPIYDPDTSPPYNPDITGGASESSTPTSSSDSPSQEDEAQTLSTKMEKAEKANSSLLTTVASDEPSSDTDDTISSEKRNIKLN